MMDYSYSFPMSTLVPVVGGLDALHVYEPVMEEG